MIINIRTMIKDEAKRRKISENMVSTVSGVDRHAVYRFLNNQGSSIHCDDLFKLIDFCGYEITRKE